MKTETDVQFRTENEASNETEIDTGKNSAHESFSEEETEKEIDEIFRSINAIAPSESDFDKNESDERDAERVFGKRQIHKAETINPAKKIAIVLLNGVGCVSMCISIIIMAVVLMISLFVPTIDITIMAKLSPIIAILSACEILLSYLKHRTTVKVNIICTGMSAVLLTGCLIGGAMAGKGFPTEEKAAAELRIQEEIYNACYSELKYAGSISLLKTKVTLNSFSLEKDYTISDLAAGDIVNVEVEYKAFEGGKKNFAEQSKAIMDTFKALNISASTFSFVFEDELGRLSLYIDGKYQQDYSVAELSNMTYEITAIDADYLDDVETEHISNEEKSQDSSETNENVME